MGMGTYCTGTSDVDEWLLPWLASRCVLMVELKLGLFFRIADMPAAANYVNNAGQMYFWRHMITRGMEGG